MWLAYRCWLTAGLMKGQNVPGTFLTTNPFFFVIFHFSFLCLMYRRRTSRSTPRARRSRRAPYGRTSAIQRRGYRRFTSGVSTIGVPFSPIIAPDKTVVRLKYTANTTRGNVVFSDTQFRLNSPFDPEVAVGGNQPTGFDQWSAFYNRYRVFRCDVHVQQIGTAVVGNVVMITPANSSSPFVSIQEQMSNPRTVSKMAAGGTSVIDIKRSYYLPAITGLTAGQYKADNDYSAPTNGNPNAIMNLHLGIGASDVTTTQGTGGFITLVYHIEFFDRVVLGVS